MRCGGCHHFICCCRDDETKQHTQKVRQEALAKVAAFSRRRLKVGKDSSAWALPGALWEPIMAVLTGAADPA